MDDIFAHLRRFLYDDRPFHEKVECMRRLQSWGKEQELLLHREKNTADAADAAQAIANANERNEKIDNTLKKLREQRDDMNAKVHGVGDAMRDDESAMVVNQAAGDVMPQCAMTDDEPANVSIHANGGSASTEKGRKTKGSKRQRQVKTFEA